MLQCDTACCSVCAGKEDIEGCTTDCFAVCCSVLQCVAVCCSVLQHVAARCSVLQSVTVCYNIIRWQCGMYGRLSSVCCSVLQCVVMGCRVLQCIATSSEGSVGYTADCLRCVAVCCSVL